MTYQARVIGTIPSGFKWYITFLEDSDSDEGALKRVLCEGFSAFGYDIDTDVLAIRGYNAKVFRDSFYAADSMIGLEDKIPVPSIVITDKPPKLICADRRELNKAGMICIPLEKYRNAPKAFTALLRKLVSALESPNAATALNALKRLQPPPEGLITAWLRKYKALFFEFHDDDVFIKIMS